MNIDWIDFLKSKNATISGDSEIHFQNKQQDEVNAVVAVTHLASLKIVGKDAAQFLQGQLTCNIKDLNESNSFFAAFCNNKGRVITTLLILKTADAFLLILPDVLTEKVSAKLQMYVLRSDVQITNITDELAFIGVNSKKKGFLPSLPETNFAVTNADQIIIKLPLQNDRYLMICSFDRAKVLWKQLTDVDGFFACDSNSWIYQDISAGLAWLIGATSEEYIPQMLNIDKLGGISFNKGCYTGQEIIARTHYLGKAKRELFLAKCEISAILNATTKIMTSENDQTIGKVVSFQSNSQNILMLVVISTADAGLNNLILNSPGQDKITIIDFL